MLVINPADCIDCGLCEPECPESAIFSDEEIPGIDPLALEINARFSELGPTIYKSKSALPEAESWQGLEEKWQLLNEGVPATTADSEATVQEA